MAKMIENTTGVLQDFSLDVLCKAIQRNRQALHALSRLWPGADIREDDEVSWCITGLREPFFNCVYRTNIKRGHVDAIIEDAMARAKSRNVHLWWFIATDTHPANIAKNLKAHGFFPNRVTGMALDLFTINSELSELANLKITAVRDPDTLRLWSRIAVTGFEMPEEVEGDWFNWYGNIGLGPGLPIQHFLGWWNGEPAATASLLLAEGVAGIYNVAVVPQKRRLGLGLGMTMQPLREARNMGYRIAILQASQQGLSVYRRIGFQECCKLMSYVWISGPRFPGQTDTGR